MFGVCVGSAVSLARVTSLSLQHLHGHGPGILRVELVLGGACHGLVHLIISLGGLPGCAVCQGPRCPLVPHQHSLLLTCFPKSAAGFAQCHLHNLTGHSTRCLFTGCQTAGWSEGGHCVTIGCTALMVSNGRHPGPLPHVPWGSRCKQPGVMLASTMGLSYRNDHNRGSDGYGF